MLQKFLLLFRLRLLFGASVMLVMVMGWPQPPLWLQWTSLLLVVVTAINTLRHKRIFLSLVLILGFTNMALLGIEQMLELPENLTHGIGLFVFYLAMVASLFHRVTHERPVTGELIYGLLAFYLLLALAFAMAYQMINSLVADAFWSSHGNLQLDDFVYYSLVTLTTVGYGDIHALAPAARLLAGAEAVAGVMFIAIAVARSLMLMSDRDTEV
ncbi:MAG: potassium channel family protein [Pseudomonas sp.]|uniref:Ion channel n=1 Tax=Pseudomonas anguilliseptica TaxID=53406 RepID=A0A1H5CR66_PSEAG|nr:potassium channel family protein [Pseudomonas anguilliseptica]SED69004.1 Ion channel [Pseudomonas anguilliseptica]